MYTRKQKDLDVLTEEEVRAVTMRDETAELLQVAKDKCEQIER